MDSIGLRERIIALLEIAGNPLDVERIVQVVSPSQATEVRSAILELVIEGKAAAGQEGVALIAANETEELPDGNSLAEREEPELEHEKNKEIEANESDQTTGTDFEETGEQEAEEEAPAWPWPELIDEPFDEEPTPRQWLIVEDAKNNSASSEWPWPEFADKPIDEGERCDSQCAQTADRADSVSSEPASEAAGMQAPLLLHDDPVDLLPMPKNSVTKLHALDIESIADLVNAIDTPNFRKLSKHVQLRAVQALRTACRPLGYTCEPEQLEELQRVAGNGEFLFDIFGVLVSSPDWAKKAAAHPSASHEKTKSESADDLTHIIQDPVLLRRLRVGGITTLEELLSKTDEELLSIRGFGVAKLEQVKMALALADEDGSIMLSFQQDDDRMTSTTKSSAKPSEEAMSLVLDALDILDPDVWVFWPEVFLTSMAPLASKLLENSPENQSRAFINAFWDIDGMRQACRDVIPILFDRHIEEFESSAEAEGLLPDISWEQLIQECVASGIWDYDEEKGAVTKHLPSLREWLDTLDDRNRDLLELRFSGATLAEAGEAYDLTRERVRQLQSRLLEKRPDLQEDAYLHLVDSYSISAKDFARITGFDELVYGYLDIVASHPKSERKAASEMLQDDCVPEHVRQAFSQTKTDGYCMVYGKPVPARKLDITKEILEAKDETVSPLWLLHEYEQILEENGAKDDSVLSAKNERAYTSWLMRQPGILYAPLPKMIDEQDQSVRLYDDASMDFGALVDYLESGEYENVDCSAALIFRSESFASLREALDIRNEYELHVIIKRFCGPVKNLELGRCPMMTFGRASRSEQVKGLIEELGPVSTADLTRAYEERYGVDASVVQANYLQDVGKFFVNGKYTIHVDSQLPAIKEDGEEVATLIYDSPPEVHTTKTENEESVAAEPNGKTALLGLIEQHVNELGRIPVARLMAVLRQQNGIDLTAVQLRAAIKEANVSFDETKDFVSPSQVPQ